MTLSDVVQAGDHDVTFGAGYNVRTRSISPSD